MSVTHKIFPRICVCQQLFRLCKRFSLSLHSRKDLRPVKPRGKELRGPRQGGYRTVISTPWETEEEAKFTE